MSTDKEKYKNISVFIFGAGGRQVLPVSKGFFDLGCTVILYCGEKLSTGYFTKYAAKKLLFEEERKENEDFFSCGVRLIRENKYSLVVPLGDPIAQKLSAVKKDLEQYSKIAVNYPEILQFSSNKALTMKACAENNIPCPKTYSLQDIYSLLEKDLLPFPIVVKPEIGIGSVGFNILRDKVSLQSYLENYDSNIPLVIQDYVEQGNEPQLRADLFRDNSGNYKCAIVGKVTRWYPLDGGSGIHVVTIHDEAIINNCKKLLDAIQWVGYANIDLVRDVRTNEAKILEINGRVGASVKNDYVAGINISQLILENELGYPVTDMTQYEDGIETACFLPDLLWLLKSKDRFKANPSWFKRKNIKDVIFSFDDPLPTVAFVIESVLSFRDSMRKRKRY